MNPVTSKMTCEDAWKARMSMDPLVPRATVQALARALSLA
jgi:hypothetical protein